MHGAGHMVASTINMYLQQIIKNLNEHRQHIKAIKCSHKDMVVIRWWWQSLIIGLCNEKQIEKASYEDTHKTKGEAQDRIKCARNIHGHMTRSYALLLLLDGGAKV